MNMHVLEMDELPTWLQELWELDSALARRAEIHYKELTSEPKFTIEEIRNYILSQDSRGDIIYFLSEENIKKSNET